MENHSNVNTSNSGKLTQVQEKGKGKLILCLGIISLGLIGPFVGIPVWVMGNKDLKKINSGLISIKAKTKTKIGMILGIIGTFVIPLIWILAILVGISTLNEAARVENRDALFSECSAIAALSQQYYSKPIVFGGGENSFIGFEIPEELKETSNGTFSIEDAADTSISIIGLGKEIGNDGNKQVSVKILAKPESIEPIIIN